jgi:hypothetical protein
MKTGTRTDFFRKKAAELRASVNLYMTEELQQGILELADRWEELARQAEEEAQSDGTVYHAS